MAYTPTEWYVQAPITQESMNKIEQGIKDAHDGLDTVEGDLRSASTRMNQLDTRIGTNAEDIVTLRTQFSGMTTNAEDGRKAWAQVQGAIEMSGDVVTKSLNDRIGNTELDVGNLTTEISAARKGKTYLRDKIDEMDNDVSRISGSVATIEGKFASAKGEYNSVEDRFAAAETRLTNLDKAQDGRVSKLETEVTEGRGTNGTSLNDRFDGIESQLRAAKSSSAKSTQFETIDARFEELETEVVNARGTYNEIDTRLDWIDDLSRNNSQVSRLGAAETNLRTLNTAMAEAQANISALENSKVNTSDVYNDVDRDTAGKVLDARQGKVLQDQITALQTNASTEGDRIDALEAELDMASADGSRRIDLVEADVSAHDTELTDAHTSTANNTSYGSIDLRFEANEAKANTLETNLGTVTTLANQLHTDVQTIADELLMIDHGTIVDQNTRIDTLESTVASIQSTTSGQAEWGSRLDAAESDIDTLQDAVGSLNATVTGTNGLTERMLAAESDISDAATAAANAASAAQAAQTTANAAATQTSLNTLAGRVTTLEGKDTVLVSNVTFDEETGAPEINDPSENCDYLIKGADNKYYYWRYLGQQDGWQMISGGGGGSGNGNNNAEVYASDDDFELAVATTKKDDTDYYVYYSGIGYRHFRFIYNEENETWTQIEIGISPTNIKKYNIIKRAGTKQENNETVDVNYLDLYEYDYGVTNEDNFNPAETGVRLLTSVELPVGGGGGGDTSTMDVRRITPYSVTAVQNTTDVVPLQFFFTTGNVSGSGAYTLTVTHEGQTTTLIENEEIVSGDPANASYTWPTTEIEENGVTKIVPMEPDDEHLPVGFYQINIAPYCTETGVDFIYNLRIVNSEDERQSKTPIWSVRVINLSVESSYSDNTVLDIGTGTTFTYIPVGNIEKTANIFLDGNRIGTRTLSRTDQNKEFTFDIAQQDTAGVHQVEMYLSARINNKDVYSNHIYKDIIWRDSTSDQIFISSPYRNRTISLQQYKTITIPYTLAGNANNNYTVQYYLDSLSNLVNEQTFINNNVGSWSYRATSDGSHTLIIKCGDASISVGIEVEQLPIDISPVLSNLAIDFNPEGLNNNSTQNREWTNGTYSLSVSPNFDWYNGGYGKDTSGSYFLVKAGTRARFNYKMFKSYQHQTGEETYETRSVVFRDGAEMKIVFKTAAVRNADATWFTNMGRTTNSENAPVVGVELKVHEGYLKTDSASDTEVKTDSGESVAATNTYLYFPYSEEDKIELDISINKEADEEEKGLFLMSYEDGCPSKAYPYSITEALYQEIDNESEIVIGSDDCDVYIYRFKIYTTALDTEDVLRNFIADGKDVEESISRYERNSIYWDTQNASFTPYETQDTILDPVRLATKMPDVKILMLDTPTFTTSKKDFIAYSSLRCIHSPGGKVYPSRGKEDNWLFQNGYHAGQGTTSDKYGNAGRNIDFLFECDGVHNPSDKIKPGKGFIQNYQSSLILGYGTDEQEEPTYCLDWKDEDTWQPNTAYNLLYTMYDGTTHDMLVRYNNKVYKCLEAHTSGETFDATKWEEQEGYSSKISLTSTSIPNNFFNLKVNIASSENVNNALLQKRYNDFLRYQSPAYKRDHRIKNDMEFVPAVLFVRENDEAHTTEMIEGKEVVNYTNHKEFNDTNWHFYALGNIGDSKKTDYTRAYDPSDINEFTLEISDNNTNNSQFQSGVYMASYYREVVNPVVENIENYYIRGTVYGTVEYNSETQYYGDFTKTTDTTIKAGTTYYTFIEKRRSIEPYHAEQDKEDDGSLKDTFTAKSDAGEGIQPMSYLYPITMEEWTGLDANNQPKNMRYWSLFNEDFDGNHSFEMRYAFYGNYRDGKIVNGDSTESNAVLKRNSAIWRAFYTWLITSSDERFIAELDEWVVRSSVAFFYAFTHYYTMMDNRAKNTFWHFAKTGSYRKVHNPTKDMLHVYEEATGAVTEDTQNQGMWNGTFAPTSDSVVTLPYFIDVYTAVTEKKFREGVTYYRNNNGVYSAAEVTANADIPEDIIYYTHSYDLTRDTTVQANTTYYQRNNNNEYVEVQANVGDPIKQYYTQYAFDMWVYDCDTAIGIDNNGELIFPYGKEDSDFRIENDSSSSYVFNGAGSIFWRRLKANFNSDIVDAFTGVETQCFDADNLIAEFDKVQECYPEAVWRLDVERKYIRSFTGDYGYTKANPNQKVYLTRQEKRFLRDMMQGRKKYQRRQWCKDQDTYFGSKYLLPNVFNDLFDFSCYNPGNLAVTPNWDLTITPYQDMYINISYAETMAPPFRAKAGKAYEFKSILNDMNDSRIRIYGANHIQSLAGKAKREDPNDPERITGAEGLASFYMKANSFQHTHKLRELIIGTPNTGYENGNFTTLNITDDNPILEVLDIQNCNNLGGQLNLGKSTSLKRIEAQGTKITSVNLPQNTSIEVLHLPETINNVTIYAAKNLNDITLKTRAGVDNSSSLTTLLVSDSDYSANVNWMTLATAALSHLTSLQLIGLRLSSIGNISELEAFASRKEDLGTVTNEAGEKIPRVQLTGSLYVNGEWSEIEKVGYERVWNNNLNLIVIDDNEHKKTKHRLIYHYEINGIEYEYSIYANAEADIEDIYYQGLINMPTKAPSASKVYTFGTRRGNSYQRYTGWRIRGDSKTLYERYSSEGRLPRVNSETHVDAVFTSVDRLYSVNWYVQESDTLPIKTETDIPYGGGADLVAPTVEEIHAAGKETRNILFDRGTNPIMVRYNIFNGWKKLSFNINPSIEDNSFDIYGDWISGYESLPSIFANMNDSMTPIQLYVFANMSDAERRLYADVGQLMTIDTGYMGPDSTKYDAELGGELLIGHGATHLMTLSNGETATYPYTAQFKDEVNDNPFRTNIQPFKAGNDEFTIAIDYAFDDIGIDDHAVTGIDTEMVLASCYLKDNSNAVFGFKLFYYYDRAGTYTGPRVSFGDTSISDGYATQSVSLGTTNSAKLRNTIVLRHPKDSNILYVYSGVNGGGADSTAGHILTDMALESSVQHIEWNNINTDAYLTFGTHIIGESTTGRYKKGKGTIYWAKYWNTDLGVGECRRIASWSHEQMTYAIEEYAGMDSQYSRFVFKSGSMPNVVLTSLNAPMYGHACVKSPTKAAGATIKWPDSDLQKIANKRIFQSLPIALQSIISKSPVTSRQAVYSSTITQGGTFSIGTSDDVVSNDYVFFPSIVELGSTNTTYKPREASGTMIWYNAANTTVYKRGSSSWSVESKADNAAYMNLRFPGVPISTISNTIYYVANSSSLSSTIYNLIGPSSIRRGTIFIDGTTAYIYVTYEDIQNGALIYEQSQLFDCNGQGGWVKAESYYTRSPFDGHASTGSFICINYNGSIPNSAVSADNAGYGFNYSFSV